jgi:hypothetical protein
MDKKGDYKWSIILSLILGLLILGLSLFFIFNEYFTSEDTDLQICRQSIQVRALLPEVEEGGFTLTSFKEDFPLKCKTMVKTIEKEDVEDVEEIIAETMAECWALYDKGTTSAFPADFYGATSACVPCARIHLTEEAKVVLREKGVDNINIRDALDERMTEEYSYLTYLKNSGDDYSAFGRKSVAPFFLEGDNFSVNQDEVIKERNIMTTVEISEVSLPKLFYLDKGDLLINYGIIVQSSDWYTPYLFYFQVNQKPNPFEEVKNEFYSWSDITRAVDISNSNFCESWEGIPA